MKYILSLSNANLHSSETYSLLGGRREFLDFECTNTEKLEFPLDSLSCHKHKGHQRSIVGFCNQEKCGDKRPSSMELFAIAALTHEEIRQVDWKRSYKNRSDESRSDKDRSDECYFTFPVCLSFLGIVSLLLTYH
jgi:hypothetical protein